MTDPPLDFILAGVGKSATTWVWSCLEDHPDVFVPETDSLNYFDIHYHERQEWFSDKFSNRTDESVVGEASPSYLIDHRAPERIAEIFPDIELIFCIRNPVDRAFSHWWHGKSQKYWTYEFEEIFEVYPPHQIWVTPGFYSYHLKKYDKYFDEDQMHIHLFDDLLEDDMEFIQDIYASIGADEEYLPNQVGEKVNEAALSGGDLITKTKGWVRENAPQPILHGIEPIWEKTRTLVEDKDQYEEGMDPEIRQELEKVYVDDVRQLSERIDRDLSHWFEYETM